VVARFGEAVSANCSTALQSYLNMGWEAPLGSVSPIGQGALVTWSLASLNTWSIEPICYITVTGYEDQCERTLQVTVYSKYKLYCLSTYYTVYSKYILYCLQSVPGTRYTVSSQYQVPGIRYQVYFMPACVLSEPPDSVSVSELGVAGPMQVGVSYQLQCDVTNVAPVRNLSVVWYRGNDIILTEVRDNAVATPQNESFALTITPEKSHHGERIQCQVRQNLGTSGPAATWSQPYVLRVTCESSLMLLHCLYSPRASTSPGSVFLTR